MEQMALNRQRFIEKLGLYYENYGIPRIGGKIVGLLLTAKEPVSAEEIADTLSVSRSSVSTNIRLLLMAGFVEVAPEQAGRIDRFALSGDAWLNAIRARIEGFMNLKAIAGLGISAVGEDAGACERMREMADWVDLMIEEHKHIQREWMKREKGE